MSLSPHSHESKSPYSHESMSTRESILPKLNMIGSMDLDLGAIVRVAES